MGCNPQSQLQQQPPISFPVGSLVEIQSTEEDFKGVCFSATVISPKKSSNNKPLIHVEYHHLLAEDDGSEELLREHVDFSWIKPLPPTEVQPETGFQWGDIVDAFFNDGWWKGSVTGFIGERIVVTFKHPPDERAFEVAELRVHWDWVNGYWCRSLNKVEEFLQSVEGRMFDVGEKVEVSFLENDVWYPASVCEALENGALLVEYSSKGNDEKAHAIKITVDSLHVRPCPPLLKDRSFALLDKVDAYFDFGWRSASVTKVLEGGKYLVFFKQKKSEKEFSQSELRPQMKWEDGKWIMNPQSSLISVDTEKRVELSSSVTQKPTLKTRKKLILCDSLSPPLKQHTEGNNIGPSQKDTHGGLIKEKFSSVSPVPVGNVISSATQTATGNHSSGNPSSGKKIVTGPYVFKEDFASAKKVRNKRKVGDMLNDAKKVDTKSSTAKENMVKVLQGKEIVKPVGVEKQQLNGSENMKSKGGDLSRAGELSRKRKGTSENAKTVRDDFSLKNGDLHKTPEVGKMGTDGSLLNKGDKLSETGEASLKRKRGRPPSRVNGKHKKVNDKKSVALISDPHAILAPETPQSQEDATLVVGSSGDKVAHSQPDNENMELSAPKGASPEVVRQDMFEETLAVIDLIMQQENNSSSTERRESVGEKLKAPLEAATMSKSTEMSNVMEVDKEVSSESPHNELDDDDVPISRWMKGVRAPFPPIIDGTSKGKASGNRTPSVDTASIDATDLTLPFVKTPSLWKMIESIEVFQRMPQAPHFQPLEHLNESTREGIALGHMMIFSTLVDRVSKLQFADVGSKTNDIMETLSDLEAHGFDVTAVRDCVSKLVALKDEQEKIMNEVNELNVQLSLENCESRNNEKEIYEIEEEIEKLQSRLYSAKTAKSKRDDKIADLTAKLTETEGSVKARFSEFRSIANSVLP